MIVAVISSFVLGLIMAAVVLVTKNDYPFLFSSDSAVRQIVKDLTPLLCLCIVIDIVQPVLSGLFSIFFFFFFFFEVFVIELLKVNMKWCRSGGWSGMAGSCGLCQHWFLLCVWTSFGSADGFRAQLGCFGKSVLVLYFHFQFIHPYKNAPFFVFENLGTSWLFEKLVFTVYGITIALLQWRDSDCVTCSNLVNKSAVWISHFADNIGVCLSLTCLFWKKCFRKCEWENRLNFF